MKSVFGHDSTFMLVNRNAIAMRTAHMEIMRTLVKLCDLDPETLMVPFDRVKE